MRGRTKRDALYALAALPYGFWAMYWYENGFDWLVAIFGLVLFVIVPGVLSVFWEKI